MAGGGEHSSARSGAAVRAASATRARARETGQPLVFIVDDDPATLELLTEIAEDRGWLVATFSRLSELQTSLSEGGPTLIILDDDLPDGRGGDLVRELWDAHGREGTLILVCTAAHPMRQAEIGSWAPVVAKPFRIAEIERYLGAAARRRDDHATGRYERAG